MVRRAALLVVAALLVACDPGFESPEIVLDLRLMGLRADPPEVVADFDPSSPTIPPLPPVEVTVLVADPADTRALAWSMRACEPRTQEDRCDGASQLRAMGDGVIPDPEEPFAEPIRASVTADVALLQASLESDPQLGLSGVEVLVEVRVWPEGGDPADAIVGVKSIVYAPRIPAERVANTNPIVDTIAVGPADMPELGIIEDCRVEEPVFSVTAGTEIRLSPIELEGVRETYVLPTLDGGSRTITENLRYSWFATEGGFSAGQSGGATDPFGNEPTIWTKYRVPDAPGRYPVWMVVRDERGGTSWVKRCVIAR